MCRQYFGRRKFSLVKTISSMSEIAYREEPFLRARTGSGSRGKRKKEKNTQRNQDEQREGTEPGKKAFAEQEGACRRPKFSLVEKKLLRSENREQSDGGELILAFRFGQKYKRLTRFPKFSMNYLLRSTDDALGVRAFCYAASMRENGSGRYPGRKETEGICTSKMKRL